MVDGGEEERASGREVCRPRGEMLRVEGEAGLGDGLENQGLFLNKYTVALHQRLVI